MNIVPDAQLAESPTEQVNDSVAEPTMVEAAIGHAPSNLSDAYIGYLPGPLVPNTDRQVYSLTQKGATSSISISEGALEVTVHVRIHGGYHDFVPEAGDTQFEHIFTITWRYVTGSVAVTDTIPTTAVPLSDGSDVTFSAVITYLADFDGANLDVSLENEEGTPFATKLSVPLPRSATPQTITIQMNAPVAVSPAMDMARFKVWLYHEFLLVGEAESVNYSVGDWPIVVDNLQDVDDGDYTLGKQTLREALKRAGQKSVPVNIPVKVSGTIPVVATPVVLEGANPQMIRLLPVAGPVTLSDQGQGFGVLLGVATTMGKLDITGVSFASTGGNPGDPISAIYNVGTLILRDCTFNNPRNLTAAISADGPLELYDCQFGGTWNDTIAVLVGGGGPAKLQRCQFNVISDGGFIGIQTSSEQGTTIRDCEFNFTGDVTAIYSLLPQLVKVTYSHFNVNTLGSVSFLANTALISFQDCVFEADVTSAYAFRFEDDGPPLVRSAFPARACLFVNRGSQGATDCLVNLVGYVSFDALNCIFSGEGGGVRTSDGARCTLDLCTLLTTGTACTVLTGGELRLGSSILAGSISRRHGQAGASSLDVRNEGGLVISYGYNAIENPGPGFNPMASDIVGRDLHVRPTTTGGITLMAYSPCVNAGNPGFNASNFNPPLLNDLSGNVRVVERIDIGAIEVSDILLEALALARADPAFDKNQNGIPDLVDLVSGIDPKKDVATDPPVTVLGVPFPSGSSTSESVTTNLLPSGTTILETRIDERTRSLQGILQTSTDLITWTDRAVYTPNGTGLGYTRTGANGVNFVEHEQSGYCWLIHEAITVNGGRLFVRVKALALP